jgi:hypothetical protein
MTAPPLTTAEIIRDTQRQDYALSDPQLAGQFCRSGLAHLRVDREFLIRNRPISRSHLAPTCSPVDLIETVTSSPANKSP